MLTSRLTKTGKLRRLQMLNHAASARHRGRPNKCWFDVVRDYMRANYLTVGDAADVARWKRLSKKADTGHQGQSPRECNRDKRWDDDNDLSLHCNNLIWITSDVLTFSKCILSLQRRNIIKFPTQQLPSDRHNPKA